MEIYENWKSMDRNFVIENLGWVHLTTYNMSKNGSSYIILHCLHLNGQNPMRRNADSSCLTTSNVSQQCQSKWFVQLYNLVQLYHFVQFMFTLKLSKIGNWGRSITNESDYKHDKDWDMTYQVYDTYTIEETFEFSKHGIWNVFRLVAFLAKLMTLKDSSANICKMHMHNLPQSRAMQLSHY